MRLATIRPLLDRVSMMPPSSALNAQVDLIVRREGIGNDLKGLSMMRHRLIERAVVDRP